RRHTSFSRDWSSDVCSADLQAESLTLQVDPWPLDGQPPEFTGAVGRFTVDAEVEPRRLAVGETCRLTVKIAGDGDLTRFAAPALRRKGGGQGTEAERAERRK